MINVIGIKGIWIPIPPFVIDEVDYTSTSISSISNLIRKGIDPYLEYYTSKGISIDVYNKDKEKDIVIVTLESDIGDTIHIPETYIANYPIEVAYKYTRRMISIDLGDLPNDIKLTELEPRINELVSGYIGVLPIIKEHVGATNVFYGKSKHLVKEALRINKLNNTANPYKIIASLHNSISNYRKRVSDLEAVIRSYKL